MHWLFRSALVEMASLLRKCLSDTITPRKGAHLNQKLHVKNQSPNDERHSKGEKSKQPEHRTDDEGGKKRMAKTREISAIQLGQSGRVKRCASRL